MPLFTLNVWLVCAHAHPKTPLTSTCHSVPVPLFCSNRAASRGGVWKIDCWAEIAGVAGAYDGASMWLNNFAVLQVTVGGMPSSRVDLLSSSGADGLAAMAEAVLAVTPPPLAGMDAVAGAVTSQLAVRGDVGIQMC